MKSSVCGYILQRATDAITRGTWHWPNAWVESASALIFATLHSRLGLELQNDRPPCPTANRADRMPDIQRMPNWTAM